MNFKRKVQRDPQLGRGWELLDRARDKLTPQQRQLVDTIRAAIDSGGDLTELGEVARQYLEERGLATDGGPEDRAEMEELYKNFARKFGVEES